MAFNINYLAKVSSSANTTALNVWTYNGSSTGADDTVAEIAASGYFNSFMQNLTLGDGPFQVGDTIFVSGNDANEMVKVATVVTNVTVSVFAAAGTVDTANLVNGAVTAAKLASDAVTTVKILDANVTSAKLAANVLQYKAVAITAAEFKALYSAGKSLVAAAGANTLLVLEQCQLLMTYGAANYAAGGVVAIQYDSTVHGAGVIASTTLSAATFQAAVSTAFTFNAGVVPLTFSTCVNKALYLSAVTADFTTGDSAFVAHVWYRVIPTV